MAGRGLLGADVVEAAPSLDSTPATCLFGGRIAIEAMADHGLSRRRDG
jgi:arginase family enzyme